jgi:hypothetical protein
MRAIIQHVLRTDLLCAQVRFSAATCDKLARRANQSKPVQSFAQKYSASHQTQISGYLRAVPTRQEGRIARRHERGTGCDGRSSVRRERLFAGRSSVSEHGAQDDRRCSVRQNRVVLTPVAGAKLSVAYQIQPDRSAIKPAAMEAKGIRLQGELGISRQTIAQGMPDCSGCTCMLVCIFLCASGTRDRGCSEHPAFPAPSLLRERNFQQASGARRRENANAH